MVENKEPSFAKLSSHSSVIFVCVVATIGGFLFGFDSGVINGTVEGLQLAFKSESIGTGFNVSSMLIGCAVGAFSSSWLAGKLGRRTILQLSAVLFVLSAWGSGISTGSGEFVFYRVIGGLAVGGASIIAPAYIAEVSPAKYRGMLTSIQQIAIVSGLFCSFISNYLLADIASGSTKALWLDFAAWRWMFWVELVPAVLYFVLLFFIPESPRFLVSKGKTGQAKFVFKKLLNVDVEQKINDIKLSIEGEQQRSKANITSSTKKHYVLWIGIGLASFQQLVGINVVFYYGAILWQAVGFSESDSLLINVISGGLSICACAIALLVIDRIGRRPLLVMGSAGMSICLTIMTICFYLADLDSSGSLVLGDLGPLALISANLYVFCFNLSWGPVMWVMLGEMFPNSIKDTGLAVSGLIQWGTNFAVTLTFPVLLLWIGLSGTYSLYAAFAMASLLFVLLVVKETKGKELEEM